MKNNDDNPNQGHDSTEPVDVRAVKSGRFTETTLTTWVSNRGTSAPLFATEDGTLVKTRKSDGNRTHLKRSEEMEQLLRDQLEKVEKDYKSEDDAYQGVLYLIFVHEEGEIIPLYAGGFGKFGDDGQSLSENIANKSKLGRFGYGTSHHIGAISATVLDSYEDDVAAPRYEQWAQELFEPRTRRLTSPVRIWARAWRHDDTGPVSNNSDLEEVEDELIRIASSLYPERILNVHGTVQ